MNYFYYLVIWYASLGLRRCVQLPGIFQFFRDARFDPALLHLSRQCPWPRRRSSYSAGRVRDFCLFPSKIGYKRKHISGIIPRRISNRYIFPTMEELSDQISDVMLHFNIKSFVGLGVGSGANVLVRFALTHPERVCIRLELIK